MYLLSFASTEKRIHSSVCVDPQHNSIHLFWVQTNLFVYFSLCKRTELCSHPPLLSLVHLFRNALHFITSGKYNPIRLTSSNDKYVWIKAHKARNNTSFYIKAMVLLTARSSVVRISLGAFSIEFLHLSVPTWLFLGLSSDIAKCWVNSGTLFWL